MSSYRGMISIITDYLDSIRISLPTYMVITDTAHHCIKYGMMVSNLKSKEVVVDALVCNELGVVIIENHYLFLESRVIQQVINYSRVFIVITIILVHNQK